MQVVWFVPFTESPAVAGFRSTKFALVLAFVACTTVASQEVALTSDEECAIAVLEFTTLVMAGLSPDADDQMRRALEAEHAKSEERLLELDLLCTNKSANVGLMPPERQDIVLSEARCRYQDRLAAEYARDGLSLPAKFAALCKRP